MNGEQLSIGKEEVFATSILTTGTGSPPFIPVWIGSNASPKLWLHRFSEGREIVKYRSYWFRSFTMLARYVHLNHGHGFATVQSGMERLHRLSEAVDPPLVCSKYGLEVWIFLAFKLYEF